MPAKTSRHQFSTTIRMGSTAFELHTEDLTTGEAHTMDLSKASRVEKAKLGGILCALHGITNQRSKKRKPKITRQQVEDFAQHSKATVLLATTKVSVGEVLNA